MLQKSAWLTFVESEFLNLNILGSVFGIHFLNLSYFADILGQKLNIFMLKGRNKNWYGYLRQIKVLVHWEIPDWDKWFPLDTHLF